MAIKLQQKFSMAALALRIDPHKCHVKEITEPLSARDAGLRLIVLQLRGLLTVPSTPGDDPKPGDFHRVCTAHVRDAGSRHLLRQPSVRRIAIAFGRSSAELRLASSTGMLASCSYSVPPNSRHTWHQRRVVPTILGRRGSLLSVLSHVGAGSAALLELSMAAKAEVRRAETGAKPHREHRDSRLRAAPKFLSAL
jgi:hypothetical protein